MSSDRVKCPYCGFLAHPKWSDGNIIRYQCERCHSIYVLN